MRPEDFNPYAKRESGGRGKITTDNIDLLKTIFVDNKPL